MPVIKGIFNLTYVRNPGVAFGLFPGQRLILVFIGIAVCAAVIYFYMKGDREDILFKVYLAVILGGSLGNLFNRIFSGYVIDYLDFRVFPVFNFADIAINIGVFLVILDLAIRRK
jgi:signal peptidase II